MRDGEIVTDAVRDGLALVVGDHDAVALELGDDDTEAAVLLVVGLRVAVGAAEREAGRLADTLRDAVVVPRRDALMDSDAVRDGKRLGDGGLLRLTDGEADLVAGRDFDTLRELVTDLDTIETERVGDLLGDARDNDRVGDAVGEICERVGETDCEAAFDIEWLRDRVELGVARDDDRVGDAVDDIERDGEANDGERVRETEREGVVDGEPFCERDRVPLGERDATIRDDERLREDVAEREPLSDRVLDTE